MKSRYGRIKVGKPTVEFDFAAMGDVYEQVSREECPDGFKPVERILPYPDVPSGKKIAFRVTDVGDRLTKEGFLVDEDHNFGPRRFSKLKIYGAITKVGAWDAIRSWLEAKTVDGMNGWIAFQLAQDISDDHPMFAALSSEAKLMLGLTDEQFDELLNACVIN